MNSRFATFHSALHRRIPSIRYCKLPTTASQTFCHSHLQIFTSLYNFCTFHNENKIPPKLGFFVKLIRRRTSRGKRQESNEASSQFKFQIPSRSKLPVFWKLEPFVSFGREIPARTQRDQVSNRGLIIRLARRFADTHLLRPRVLLFSLLALRYRRYRASPFPDVHKYRFPRRRCTILKFRSSR